MALPDFVIIGAMKAGTTSAARNLALHPDVWLVTDEVKKALGDEIGYREVHFFDRDERWARGVEWYERFFEAGLGHRCIGEKTPNYLGAARAHPRMHETIPHAKLVAFVREPAERAFSHWWHMVQERPAWDRHRFGAMRFAEAARLALDLAKRSPARTPGLLRYGLYARHLEHLMRWYRRERILVCVAERVRRDMSGEYARVFDFIGVKSLVNAPFEEAHVRRGPQPAPMDEETRAMLDEYFRPHDERLFVLLGEEIAEWRRAR